MVTRSAPRRKKSIKLADAAQSYTSIVTILARAQVSFPVEKMKVQVTLYSKPGCHLCEEMKKEIACAGCAEAYALKEVNIERDAELFARYCHDIPVLNIHGVDVFKHRLRRGEFKAYLMDILGHLTDG